MISAEGVDGRGLHSRKIIRHGVGRRKWLAPAGGGKWTVGHPLDAQPLFAPREELSVHAHARPPGHNRTTVRGWKIARRITPVVIVGGRSSILNVESFGSIHHSSM